MTQAKHRPARQKSIGTSLAIRCFSRELKKLLLGPDNQDCEQYGRFEEKLAKVTGLIISEPTWHKWWYGKHRPSATALRLIGNKFPDLVARWFDFNSNDRVARHINALDFAWLEKNRSIQESHEMAYQTLIRIHTEWRPNFYRVISIPGPKERSGVSWRTAGFKTESLFSNEPDKRQNIGIGTKIGPVSDLKVSAIKSAQYHEIVNPFSSLAFMLAYAVESRLPDPGLKLAFVLDFMTAALAALHIANIASPGNVLESGRPAQICIAAREFFWLEHPNDWKNDPYWRVNHAFAQCFKPILDELLEDYEEEEAWILFLELRNEYFEALKITGLSMEKLQDYFHEFAELGLSP